MSGSASGAGCGSPRAERLPDLLSALDVFVSASREEAFGLAVVEALAAGLPVFHSTCPAVDDLPADQSPGAHRVDGTPEALTAALRRQRHAAPRRREPPPVVRHYDIAESGRRLTRLYERVLAAPQPSQPSRPPAPPVPPSSTERARP
ncbi:glycosyltransferase [Streptomyces katsurahamanus]|uniref:glycosyltransferase n=1 Tax=Streptomyces katsurahamanus TaxID=2577098 RepID=UPI00389A3238